MITTTFALHFDIWGIRSVGRASRKHSGRSSDLVFCFKIGELAQLVERLHGMQEVIGSTPLFSTD
jgi:hypothetical protein